MPEKVTSPFIILILATFYSVSLFAAPPGDVKASNPSAGTKAVDNGAHGAIVAPTYSSKDPVAVQSLDILEDILMGNENMRVDFQIGTRYYKNHPYSQDFETLERESVAVWKEAYANYHANWRNGSKTISPEVLEKFWKLNRKLQLFRDKLVVKFHPFDTQHRAELKARSEKLESLLRQQISGQNLVPVTAHLHDNLTFTLAFLNSFKELVDRNPVLEKHKALIETYRSALSEINFHHDVDGKYSSEKLILADLLELNNKVAEALKPLFNDASSLLPSRLQDSLKVVSEQLVDSIK